MYINLKLAFLAYLDNVCHFDLAYSMQVFLGILVHMHCMGAHGSAVYSSERTYVRASDIAGLQRAVLDSVGEFQTLIHDYFSCMYNLHVHVPLLLTQYMHGHNLW